MQAKIRQMSLGVVVAVIVLGGTTLAQPSDARVGTWKLNLAKSTFSPGPPPKSNTIKIEPAAGGAQKHTFDGVNAQGQSTHQETVASFDGKEVPWQAIQPPTTATRTSTLRRIDDYSFEAVGKENGKVTTTTRVVFSRDGKTFTTTATGKNAQGQTVNNTTVYDKQ